ncbi:unnamed protein product [Ostreobium quekettii]|uniref:Uncharacterized protein n=1 Tax=Ostreobium quekettii TaxID=121088 RepID=A0A8S1J038_9CHLO|nr:unnamed protein product [Ostreobium quekettii]
MEEAQTHPALGQDHVFSWAVVVMCIGISAGSAQEMRGPAAGHSVGAGRPSVEPVGAGGAGLGALAQCADCQCDYCARSASARYWWDGCCVPTQVLSARRLQ